jgi:hypothetical protein
MMVENLKLQWQANSLQNKDDITREAGAGRQTLTSTLADLRPLGQRLWTLGGAQGRECTRRRTGLVRHDQAAAAGPGPNVTGCGSGNT